MGGNPAGFGLKGLGPPDLTALGSDEGVQGHVLSLERRDSKAGSAQKPTDRSRDQALSDIGSGPENRDCNGTNRMRHETLPDDENVFMIEIARPTRPRASSLGRGSQR